MSCLLLLRGESDPYADYLVYDTFTDVNATLLPAHTPEKDAVGAGWIARGGAFTVENNTVEGGAGAGSKIDGIDTGEADVIIEAEFTRNHAAGGDNRQFGFAFRITNALNFYVVRYVLGGIASLRFAENVAGVWAELGPGWVPYAWNNLATKTMRLEITGINFEVFIDDVSQIAIADASHVGQTEHGLFFFDVSNNHGDDYRIGAG